MYDFNQFGILHDHHPMPLVGDCYTPDMTDSTNLNLLLELPKFPHKSHLETHFKEGC